MDLLTNEELKERIKKEADSKRSSVPLENLNLTIETSENGFKIGSLNCNGFPQRQASILLLICNGLTLDQCALFLNKSFSHVRRNINRVCMKLLGSDANGNADGTINSAIVRAFEWAYLFHDENTVFKMTHEEWNVLTQSISLEDEAIPDAASKVFVDGMNIEEAAVLAGIDANEMKEIVRSIELYLGELSETYYKSLNKSVY